MREAQASDVPLHIGESLVSGLLVSLAPRNDVKLALFRGGLERSEVAERNGGQRVGQC
jgi:hypothetical protein